MTEEWSAALEKAICSGTATESTLTYLRQLPLLEVSRLFGPYLTDEVSVTSAVRILGQAAAGRTHVSSEEATPILQFFSAKLTSMQTVEASVEAMAVTVQELSRHNVHTEKVFTCLHDGFLQNISLQALPTQTRHHGYVILEFMASEPMVQWFTVSFLQKLLASIDEESDPALVLRALNLHYFVALCADSDVFRPLLNDYFVSLSSYFPVTFTQPRDCGITRDDLRKALSRCMRSPLYTDLCITFLLSRLASPSTIVKREAVEVLLDIYCSDSEHPMEMLEPHILPTVTHMRNEVVKATSFSHNAPDQHLKNCLTILRSIFKKECSATPATLLCWMDPITSGVLSSLDSGKAACAAYATMLHHITQASLSCATVLFRHLLPQLTSSIGDASTDKDTLFLVLTALLTGVSDLGTSVETRPELQFRVAMISAFEDVFPSIVALAEEPVPVDGTDHTSLNIRCELVSSLLCLDLRLRPWLPDSAVHSLYIVLVTACLSSSEEVCERVSRHISRIGLVDGNELHKFLGRSLAELRPPAKNVFSLYKCLVESSAPTAVSIIESLLKRESDNITMLLQWPDIFSLCRSGFATCLDIADDAVLRMIRLLHETGATEGFEFACELVQRLPETVPSTVIQLASVEKASVLAIALISFRSSSAICALGPFEKWMPELLAAVCDERRCALAMQGLSALCLHAPGAYRALLEQSRGLGPEGQLAVCSAIVRGLYASGAVGEAEAIAGNLLAPQLNTKDGKRSGDVLTASFLFNVRELKKCVTLLPVLVAVARSAVTTSPELLQCLAQLLRDKPAELEFDCNEVLHLVRHLPPDQAPEPLNDALVECLSSALAWVGASAGLAGVLSPPGGVFQAVLHGVRSPRLQIRCASLQLLTCVASLLLEGSEQTEGDHRCKDDFMGIRAQVLKITQVALGDHKRLVRQRAAQCRQLWFKLRY